MATMLQSLHELSPVGLPLLAVVVVAALLYRFAPFGRSAGPYPPGPPGKPFIGNIMDITPRHGWLKYAQYKDIYGDIVYFHGPATKMLVLNSAEAISDLFEKRGNVYSDRARMVVAGELMGMDKTMGFIPYGDHWRIQRRLAVAALSPSAIQKYAHIQEDIAALLAKQLLEDPAKFSEYITLAAERLVLSITYGLSTDTVDNKYVSLGHQVGEITVRSTTPGAFLADLFPWMKYLPGWVPFQKEAKRARELIELLFEMPFEHVKREMAAGIAPPSLTQDLLSSEDGDTEEMQYHIKWMTGSLYGAAGETTHATVMSAILALALYPDKQRKAQEELDRVIGEGRLPLLSDRADLPYVDAIVKETMRWHPPVPLSIPRATDEDDVYRGYMIPKGTIIVPNIWAIAYAPKGPYDPRAFEPERFLVPDVNERPVDPSKYAFGFARRICPGRYLAENSIFIFIATMLAMFDIAAPKDGHLRAEFEGGLVSPPVPFKCQMTPRSSSKASQIRARAAQSSI